MSPALVRRPAVRSTLAERPTLHTMTKGEQLVRDLQAAMDRYDRLHPPTPAQLAARARVDAAWRALDRVFYGVETPRSPLGAELAELVPEPRALPAGAY